ncbi:von Willebrand factor type A domain-containing protein [Paraphoma chrysanthemicola]|uniref:von Willebrand factor type A domain-containing protein n=1 Tax=Paraphoma chrysanthemicola TaxID=798071 RepID=A0A8K0VUI0_9PLEO|nr:von Willebrand factor type A domain-containing protein [Paraphoma chrysanthemicola]
MNFPMILFDDREPPPPDFEHLGHYSDVQARVEIQAGADHAADFGFGVGQQGVWRNRFIRHDEQLRQPLRQQGSLRPISATVNVQIVHDTAKFTVTHLYKNDSRDIKQGVYQFPLPLEVTVTEFNCRIGPNRIVRGKVKPKEEARSDFDNAVRQGHTAGLVEQQTAEVFKAILGNIPANTKMRAELSFVCLLKHKTSVDRETFTLTVPTYIAPRYGDPPPGLQVTNQGLQSFALEVEVLTAEEILSIKSDTDIINVQRGVGQRRCQTWEDFVAQREDPSANLKTALITLEEGRTTLASDLVITINTALANDAEDPQASLEIHPDFKNHKAIMLTLPSSFMLQAETFSHDGEIVFVADCSGSMSDKVESLKSAMMFFLNGIPENRPFNIWRFGGHFTSMWPRSKAFNEETKREATNYVRQQFGSDMGGTEILLALKAVENAKGGYGSMDVIVLTDGQVWRPAETISFVKDRWTMTEGMTRFFSLGIGAAVSHDLVEGIAKAGGGYAEVITSASGGGWEDRVVAVLKAATTGHVGRFQVELGWKRNQSLEGLEVPKYQQSPADLCEISPFVRNRIFFLFDSGVIVPELEAIVLNARGSNGVAITKRVLPRQLHLPGSTIHKLAVRALLGDLERDNSRLHRCRSVDMTQTAFNKLIRDEAVNLGCKWSLISKWTSLYAVEEQVAEGCDDAKDLEIEDVRMDEEVGDFLLLHRGPLNPNVGRVLADAGVGAEHDLSDEESGSESDSTDSEPRPSSREPSDHSNDSGDGSDSDHDNPGHGAEGGDVDADIDMGARDAGQGQQRERDPPRDDVPRNDVPQHPGGEDNLNKTVHPAVESAEFTRSNLIEFGRPQSAAQPMQSNTRPQARPQDLDGWTAGRPNSRAKKFSSTKSKLGGSSIPYSSTLTYIPGASPLPSSFSPLPRSPSSQPSAHQPQAYPPSTYQQSTYQPSTYQPQAYQPQAYQPSSAHSISTSEYCYSPDLNSPRAPSSLQSASDHNFDTSFSHFNFLRSSSTSTYSDPVVTPVPHHSSRYNSTQPSYAASAPAYNPPASTSLLRDVGAAAKTAEEIAAENFVRGLLAFQRSDGRFEFSHEVTIEATLGSSFLSVVTELNVKLNAFNTSVTIALVVLLEEQFQICEGLWTLMVRKAKEYIRAGSLGSTADELMSEARSRMKSIPPVMNDLDTIPSRAPIATELETAPIS